MSSASAGTLSSRVITAKENRRFDRIYSMVGFLGIYFLAASFTVPILSGAGIPPVLGFAAVLGLMMLGWWLQAGLCAALKKGRMQSSRSYEQENKFYQPKLAIPVAIVAGIAAILAAKAVDSYLWRRSQEVLGAYYDEDSIIPLTAALGVFLVIMVGSFVWFFPYDRLLTGRGIPVGAILLMIAFVLASLGSGSVSGTVGLCLIGYAICSVVATNQYAITRSYRGTVVSFLTPRARRYNFLLVLVLIAAFFLLCGAFYVVVIGLRTLALIFLASMLNSGDDSDIGRLTRSDPEYQANLNEYIFGSSEPNETLNYWLFILFFILLAAGLITFLSRNTDAMRKLFETLRQWIISLFEFLFRPIIDFAAIGTGDDIFCNYVDEEEKLQDAEIREYREAAAPRRITFREFTSELHARRTPEEKYRFAYSFFVGQLRGMQMFVKTSDTPREIADRVRVSRKFEEDRELDKHLDRITGEFEQIEYAGQNASASPDALDDLCRMIKQNM